MPLSTPIIQLPRIQSKFAKKFAELGLMTLRDALFYFPFRHEDWRNRVGIAEVAIGQPVTIVGTVVSIKARRAWRRRTIITECIVTDDGRAKLSVVWFNLPFLAKNIHVGDALFLSGTITTNKAGRRQMNNPVYERPTEHPLHETLVPVYRTVDGLSQRQLRLVMKEAVSFAKLVPDPLGHAPQEELRLLGLSEALSAIHFPPDPEIARRAVERLKFDELLAWHLQVLHSMAGQRSAITIPFHETAVRAFVQRLPFTLTNDQRIAAWQVLQDIAKPEPMSRLIQGDVGSGKTVVAALIAYNVALSHHQVAFVAPTLVLAEQHWQTLVTLLSSSDVRVALLTGSAAKIFSAGAVQDVARTDVLMAINRGDVDVVLGTHAILQPDVRFPNLALVIIDEQQRFGVEQRRTLIGDRPQTPHFLSLTATPIPRSFALWLTGILAVSTITAKPPGRPPISSYVIGPAERKRVDRVITETLRRKEQVYVITPLIDESDSLGVRAATTECQRLRAAYPQATIGLLHGSLPGNERVAVLEDFRNHRLDLLVSTTVIEVGVDCPNATVMIIEGAERFGLAQLHQLRGRVGRGAKPSACYFVTDQTATAIHQRLARVAGTTDGFAIAEIDVAERGSGDIYGQRQSGLPNWQLATLSDRAVFDQVRGFVAKLDSDQRQSLGERLISNEKILPTFHPE